MSDYLFPLKKSYQKHKFASFDVETKNKDNEFYMVGFFHDDKYQCFYDIDEAYNYIKIFLRGYWITATNLGFDLTSLFFNTKYWVEFDTITNGGFMLSAVNEKLDIKFIDTLNYHKASVKQLGEIISISKHDPPEFLGKREPLNPYEEFELREYNKYDCIISYKFMVWFQEEINNLGGELKITIASTALDIWKRKFNKNVLVKEERVLEKRGVTENIKDKLFKAYYGGRTEVIQRGYFEDLEYYDFNSLYPSVMREGLPLPNSVKYIKEGSLIEIKVHEGVSNVTIKHITDELPLLPYRSKRLLFPTGKFTGWYTHIEIREALRHGYVLHQVHETIAYTRTFMPFNEYATKMYELRKKAKLNNSSEQLIYKLLMNSLYGKFAERKHQVIKHFDLLNSSVNELKTLRDLKYDNVIINDNGQGYYTYDEECDSSHVFPILPVYITALGRIKLWRKARLLDPVYMDTDSIVTKAKLPDSEELGELKHEASIKRAIFIKPKMYYINDGYKDIIKLKGVPKATLEQFKDIMNNLPVKYNKFVKLKEGIRRNLKPNSIMSISKKISLEDEKRSWDSGFSLEKQRSKAVIIDEQIRNTEIRDSKRQCVLFKNSIRS